MANGLYYTADEVLVRLRPFHSEKVIFSYFATRCDYNKHGYFFFFSAQVNTYFLSSDCSIFCSYIMCCIAFFFTTRFAAYVLPPLVKLLPGNSNTNPNQN